MSNFWSLTMYDKDGYLIDNPIKRHAVGDRNKFTFGADGSGRWKSGRAWACRWSGAGAVSARAPKNAPTCRRARVRTQERVRGTMSANVILQAIDEAAADIRVAMTQKYKVEF